MICPFARGDRVVETKLPIRMGRRGTVLAVEEDTLPDAVNGGKILMGWCLTVAWDAGPGETSDPRDRVEDEIPYIHVTALSVLERLAELGDGR